MPTSSDNEWWGPDLSPPRGPDQKHPQTMLADFAAAMVGNFRTAAKPVLAGMRIIAGAVDEWAKASRGTHDSPGVFDVPLWATGARYKKAKIPDSPACHIQYPTSLEPWRQPKPPKINTHVPKMRYRNRR